MEESQDQLNRTGLSSAEVRRGARATEDHGERERESVMEQTELGPPAGPVLYCRLYCGGLRSGLCL